MTTLSHKRNAMEKETWIEEILQSARNIKPVASNPFIATRVLARLENEKPVTERLSTRWSLVTATALIAIVAINILLWQNAGDSKNQSDIKQVIQEYNLGGNDGYSMNYSK